MTDDELKALVAKNAEAISSTQQQLELLTRQVQAMANSQASSDNRLIAAERNIQGIYDILQAFAREQNARSAHRPTDSGAN